jgi:predicted Zn-dependent protease
MKDIEFYLIRFILIAGVLLIGYYGATKIGDAYYHSLMKSYNFSSFDDQFRTRIDSEVSTDNLSKLGQIFLKTKNYDLAWRCFDRLSKMDSNWRDAWVFKGYNELELEKPQDALASLKKAEELDPVHPLTYKLLSVAYAATGDANAAKLASEKQMFLEKNYK